MNQSFGPEQFVAALYGPVQYRPAVVQLQTNHLQHNAVIQGLREALYSAINEIKSLKEQNKSLEDKMNLQQNEWRQMESQLQEELRQKDELLQRNIKRRRARTKAHVDIMDLLAKKELEQERREEGWKARCGAQEASLQELAQREEDGSWQVQQLEQEENTTTEEEEEAKIHNKEEKKKSQEEWEEDKTQKVKSQKEQKNKNKDNEKVEEERKTDDKQMAEKKENKPKRIRGKKKKNRG